MSIACRRQCPDGLASEIDKTIGRFYVLSRLRVDLFLKTDRLFHLTNGTRYFRADAVSAAMRYPDEESKRFQSVSVIPFMPDDYPVSRPSLTRTIVRVKLWLGAGLAAIGVVRVKDLHDGGCYIIIQNINNSNAGPRSQKGTRRKLTSRH